LGGIAFRSLAGAGQQLDGQLLQDANTARRTETNAIADLGGEPDISREPN
jgi:hypothetical protein